MTIIDVTLSDLVSIIPILTFIAGVLATAIVTALFNSDPVRDYIFDWIAHLPSNNRRNLRGIWKSTYKVTLEGRETTVEQLFVLKQAGRTVHGFSISGEPKSRIMGKFLGDANAQLTGRWNNADGRLYHGAFQLCVPPEPGQMFGKWVGFNRENRVQSGEWAWQRVNEGTDRKSQQAAIDNATLPSLIEASARKTASEHFFEPTDAPSVFESEIRSSSQSGASSRHGLVRNLGQKKIEAGVRILH